MVFTMTSPEAISYLSWRKPTIVAVAGGSVYTGDHTTGLSLATDGSGVLVSDQNKVNAAVAAGGPAIGPQMYFVDGTNYKMYDNGTNTVSDWATAVTAAHSEDPLPYSSANACRLITTFRGRIVLSGMVGDPQNWFMSKAGDPLDWVYGATPSAVIAVAGNNAPAGKCPDIITCIASLDDDVMFMGGDHTLWVMRGDPADGGRIDNVSTQMGILGGDSFCFDPTGGFFFFGNGVLWRMTKGSQPEPISRGKMDRTFGAIDYSINSVKLLWDETYHGVHIFIVPNTQRATTHYWWDARTDGFWIDQYPEAVGPTAVMIYDADAPGDRAVLLGGWDSYIRQEDATAKTDDGTTIVSRVKFAPITPGSSFQNARLNRVTTILGTTSDPVSLRVFAAQSPEEVVAATLPAWSYTATPQNRYSVPRIGGNSLLFELKNDSFSTAWVTGTDYVVGSQVVAWDGNPYVCLVAHTSTDSGDDEHPTPPGNTADWVLAAFRTWALESLAATIDVTGRTRHGRM